MALTFGGATSDRVVIAGSSTTNTPTEFGLAFWCYPTTLTSLRRMWTKCNGGDTGSRILIRLNGTSGDVEFLVTGNALNATTITSTTPLSATNTWYFVATSYSNSGDKKGYIYAGALGSALSTPTYGTQTALDSMRGDETGSFVWGNGRPGIDSVAFQGAIGVGLWINGHAPTLAEWQTLMYTPKVIADLKLYHQLGFNGTSTQPDWSGNGNSGTVTGATQSSHVPIALPFATLRRPIWQVPPVVTATFRNFYPGMDGSSFYGVNGV